MTDLRYLRHKRAKGRSYYYFDTGQRDAKGRPILTRLPDKRDLAFGGAYARALAARTQRSNVRNFIDLDGLIRRYERSPEFRALAQSTQRSYSRYLAVANRLIRTTQGGSPAAAAIARRIAAGQMVSGLGIISPRLPAPSRSARTASVRRARGCASA